jgi:CubicO group peptidase (beta-lactamase class C family)
MTIVFFTLSLLTELINPAPAAPKKSGETVDFTGFSPWVEKQMKDHDVPGLAIAVVKDGKIVFARGFGYRNVKEKLPVTPDTLFPIGSCTKAFTATLLGILADEGKLDWDSRIRDYLPEFKLKDPVTDNLVTPLDLLTHRTGVARHDYSLYNAPASREELVKRLRYLDSSKSFRSGFQYNNFMYVTAGYMAGRIAGTTWEDLVQKKILDPLGMKTSNFSVEKLKKMKDYALPYTKMDNKLQEIPFRNIDAVGPAGSINSSIDEMAQWLLLNLNKGKWGDTRLVSGKTMAMIHSPQVAVGGTLPEDEERFYSFYGMGWFITAYRGHVQVTHDGGIDGFLADMTLLPRDNGGMVILTNSDSGDPCSLIIANNIYDRLLGLTPIPWSKRYKEKEEKYKLEKEKQKKKADAGRKTGTVPSHPLGDYAGEYEHPGYGVLTVKKDGDGLTVIFNGIRYNVEHYHYDNFRLSYKQFDRDFKASFHTGKKGEIDKIFIPFQTGVKDIEFTRKEPKKGK